MSVERARKVKLLLFDVDGVLTDGTIFLFPRADGPATNPLAGAQSEKADAGGFAIVSQNVVEAKGFNAHDGTGITLARMGGLKTGIITKRISETVALRARDLKLDYVYQGAQDKLSVLGQIVAQAGVTYEQTAFVGDDIIDLPVMRVCGLAIAVANAREDVKREAHYITERPGGAGAGRDAVEYVLRAQGTLVEVQAAYIARRSG